MIARARQGQIDATHVILFYLLKAFAPGGADEKVQLSNTILNPATCSNPRAAQVELIRWKEALRRSQQLGLAAPDILLS